MSIFANPPTEHSTAQDQEQAYQAWAAACAKAGQTEAVSIRWGGDGDMKTKRNVVRRAINAIQKGLGANAGDYTPEIHMAMNHASQLIARIEAEIDYQAKLGNASRTPVMKAMRTSEDFANHYGSSAGGYSGEDFDVADFLRGAANMKTSEAVRNALTTGVDTAGGFTVPSRLMPGILSALVPVSALLRAGAGIVDIGEGGKNFTTAAINSIPTASWRAEAGALATSDPIFRAVTAEPKSLAFQFKISRELLADGQNIASALYVAIAQSFAKELDRVGLRGTGTAPQPRGLRSTSGVFDIALAPNGQFTNNYMGIFTGIQTLLDGNAPMPNAAIMSPRTRVALASAMDVNGQTLNVPDMIKPIQMIATSQIPNDLTLGTSTDCSEIYVGDFSNFYFMMRENVSIQVLSELYAGTGEIGFACHVRADVMVAYPAAFAVVTGVRG